MKIENFAKAFNISVRSMQKLLKELEAENVISRELVYKENGRKKANCIIFIGDKPRFTGKKAQIVQVCAADNPLKLRTFLWEGF